MLLFSAACSFAGKYFDEISQDTGKYCFGVDDTLKALEMGAVEILIVWENLETMRYSLKNHQSDGQCTLSGLFRGVHYPVHTSKFNPVRNQW